MRRAAVLAVVAALAGCGGSGPKVPHGSPDARHGTQAVDSYAEVEFLRALLIASSDSYYAGGSAEDARAQLARARAMYADLAARVRVADPVLAHEVEVRFSVVTTALRQGAAPDHYRDLAGPLSDQLMDGVSQALVPAAARSDPGLPAEALRRVALRMQADYDAASGSVGDTDARLAFEESWGLWRRSLALTAILKPKLGSQTGRVYNTLNNLRGEAFPNGPLQPDQAPVTKLDSASTRVVDALDKRFGLSAL